jgi:hypothetical protein
MHTVGYCTFLVCDPAHQALIRSIPSPEPWSIGVVPDPSGRFWFGPGITHSISHPSALRDPPKNLKQGQLLVVSSLSEDVARNVSDLLQACCDIVHLDPNHSASGRRAMRLAESDEANRPIFQTHGFFEWFASFERLPIAVEFAANAWTDRPLVYAIHKLTLSYSLDRVSWWSMHPAYGEKFPKTSAAFRDHVSTAFAINAAFAAIEELGLDVRSNASKRRWINKEIPTWNPDVLADIEGRLRDAGIDPTEQTEWIQRGAPSPAEQELTPRFIAPSPYANGNVVRDLRISLPDALHYCSYLRNFMTAHRFSEETPSIGPYEVFNVQSLARRLVLGKARCWDLEMEQLAARGPVAGAT